MLQKVLLSTLLISCGTDVSIMKRVDSEPEDSSSDFGINTEDTSNTSDLSDSGDQSSQMTDLTIGFGEIHFRQIACPACVGEPGEFDITATLNLHNPTSGDYVEHLPQVGSCTTDIYNTYVSSQPLTSSSAAYFNEISLNPSGSGVWSNLNIMEYQYLRNTSYSVISEHGNINNAFTTVEGFDSIEPYTLLWVDPSYAFDTPIRKTGTMFSWSPVVPNSLFEIMIAVYSPDGSQFLGAVTCMEQDVGYMQFPGTYFQSYPTWSLVAVHLFRHRIDRVSAEEFNGWFQSHMIWEVVGTGHIE